MKPSKGCLLDHMKAVHHYSDIPCGKPDCSYIAYSSPNFKQHQAKFHGHGQKKTQFSIHPCPYSSCQAAFQKPSALQLHLNVHEMRVFSCSYCQYRNVNIQSFKEHLSVHFNLNNFACDICPRTFSSKHKLYVHKYAVHNSDFSCMDCGDVLLTSWKLFKHRETCKERLKHSRIL